MKLSPKKINRFVVATLMLAPLVYLFGSLFAGLKGANGTQVYADEPSSFTIQYDETNLIYGKKCSTSTYGATTDDNRNAIMWFEGYNQIGFVLDSPSTPANGTQTNLYVYDDAGNYVTRFVHNDPSNVTRWGYNGPYKKFGLEFYRVDYHSDRLDDIHFHITFTTSTLVSDSLEGYQNSQYVFGQFFTKDNFVNKMGENALTDSPWGFVPAAELIKYVDTNMLHFKNNSNEGVFFYGYMYWAFHVILLDLGFYICTFVPRLFHKVVGKLEGDE